MPVDPAGFVNVGAGLDAAPAFQLMRHEVPQTREHVPGVEFAQRWGAPVHSLRPSVQERYYREAQERLEQLRPKIELKPKTKIGRQVICEAPDPPKGPLVTELMLRYRAVGLDDTGY